MYTYTPAFNDRTGLVDGEGSGREWKREKSDIGVESKQKPNTVLLDCGPTVLVAPTGDNDRVKQTLQMESERV